MRSVQELFLIYKNLLSDGWKWCTVHFVFDDGRTRHFTEYGLSENRTEVELDFKNNKVSDVGILFTQLRDAISPAPLQKPTHIELTFQPSGKFDTVLGYGEPNWDPAPRVWPDDIRAEEYTYTKAWPNGLKGQTKKRLKDPRSLICYD